jgi:hypothetical protein
MSNQTYLVFKSNGEVWITNNLADANTLTSTALRLTLQADPPLGKVCTISGSGPYTVTTANHHRDNQKYADSF